ncbi:MAG: hypothetical protein HQM10_20940 [Candidatus Riflebacteria bacterium]|nr:hypothetical protein [Candidatus Riflebacteria bacterium]
MKEHIIMKTRDGYMIKEMFFAVLFLSLAAGAACFMFFLSSKDMLTAQKRAKWLAESKIKLNRIALELQNAAEISFPFQGESKQCLYRQSLTDWALTCAPETRGFIYTDNNIYYIVKSASGTNQLKPFKGLPNPIFSGVSSVKFERHSPRLLKIKLNVNLPDDPYENVFFEKAIYLYNQ